MYTSPKPIIIKPEVDKWIEHTPRPGFERERLKELEKYNILDTLPEEEFDAITELASNICGTEIALVSLVDKNRQWFKSKIGLNVAETPREVSFCQYTILGDSLLEINDTWDSELLRNNPLVTGEPNIRFYAGAPLRTKNGNNLGSLCVIDRKPKKLDEQQKRSLTVLANQVVAQLDLRQVALKEKELNRLKTKFVSLVSHQFRTPLTVILTNAELLKLSCDEYKGHKLSSMEKYIQMITNQARRMVDLMNDVLIFSKTTADRISANPRPVDLLPLCRLLVQELEQIQPDERIVDLEVIGDVPKAFIDPQQITNALSNFLTNAFKYSDKNPSITVTHKIDWVNITIKDKGIGIPSEDFANLFQPFFRASNVKDIQGTGLGLAIAKEYVEINKGYVEISSELGKGTSVSILLPTVEAHHKRPFAYE